MNDKKYFIEVCVGIFMLLGFICFGLVAVKFGTQSFISQKGYELHAKFDSISGLKQGAQIEIAGVPIGKVTGIQLDGYRAKVDMLINEGIQIEDDALVSIRTKGIIGEKYVKITPGVSEDYIEKDGELVETESVMDIEDLIGKFIYNK